MWAQGAGPLPVEHTHWGFKVKTPGFLWALQKNWQDPGVGVVRCTALGPGVLVSRGDNTTCGCHKTIIEMCVLAATWAQFCEQQGTFVCLQVHFCGPSSICNPTGFSYLPYHRFHECAWVCCTDSMSACGWSASTRVFIPCACCGDSLKSAWYSPTPHHPIRPGILPAQCGGSANNRPLSQKCTI